MREELYINGAMVDLDENTNITLNYRSNLLGDISKIVSSNSYTIQLPKTARNRYLLDNPDAPAYESIMTRKKLPARYIRNGIEILSDAYAVILSCSEKYELGLIWGMPAAFIGWLKESGSIKDIPDNDEYLIWSNTSAYGNYGEGDYLFSYYDNGSRWAIFPFPSVRLPWLLRKIYPEGIKFSFPQKQQEMINRLVIPLVTKKDSEQFANHSGVTL